MVDRAHDQRFTTLSVMNTSASGGSAALSLWPLDTDGEGSAVYAYASTGSADTVNPGVAPIVTGKR